MTTPQHLFDTTIAAIATPPGTGAVAMVRLSGPNSWAIAKKLFRPAFGELQPWQASYGEVVTLDGSNRLDEALVLPFKAPKSFTGEDVVEFHCHGGGFLAATVLENCLAAGAIAAQPGEFTRRAFLNGRVDLSQAESILDLLDARGTAMLDVATHNLREATLAQRMEAMTEQLIAIQSTIVASVDFPDEVDEPDRDELNKKVASLHQQLQQWVSSSQHHQWIRQGLQLAIVGRPNAGKSSLFNHLLTAERAIVTPIAGTTRDTLEDTLHINGLPVTVVDTAGLRDNTTDTIEAMGMDRSWQAANNAQGVLFVVNGTEGLTPEDHDTLSRLTENTHHCPIMLVVTHRDQCLDLRCWETLPSGVHRQAIISNTTGEGLGALQTMLAEWVSDYRNQSGFSENNQAQLCLNQRQRQCLETGQSALESVLEGLANPNLPVDLLTVPLTDALRALDSVCGRDTTEDVLTSVFSQFCVGK